MIRYDVGQVGVEVNYSHMNRLTVLKMTMENWDYNDGDKYSRGDDIMKLYEADLHKVNELMENDQENFLTKEEKIELNFIFKYYGGIRKQGWTK
jgi:hypothetical protein